MRHPVNPYIALLSSAANTEFWLPLILKHIFCLMIDIKFGIPRYVEFINLQFNPWIITNEDLMEVLSKEISKFEIAKQMHSLKGNHALVIFW